MVQIGAEANVIEGVQRHWNAYRPGMDKFIRALKLIKSQLIRKLGDLDRFLTWFPQKGPGVARPKIL
jgi:hypothetical protein